MADDIRNVFCRRDNECSYCLIYSTDLTNLECGHSFCLKCKEKRQKICENNIIICPIDPCRFSNGDPAPNASHATDLHLTNIEETKLKIKRNVEELINAIERDAHLHMMELEDRRVKLCINNKKVSKCINSTDDCTDNKELCDRLFTRFSNSISPNDKQNLIGLIVLRDKESYLSETDLKSEMETVSSIIEYKLRAASEPSEFQKTRVAKRAKPKYLPDRNAPQDHLNECSTPTMDYSKFDNPLRASVVNFKDETIQSILHCSPILDTKDKQTELYTSSVQTGMSSNLSNSKRSIVSSAAHMNRRSAKYRKEVYNVDSLLSAAELDHSYATCSKIIPPRRTIGQTQSIMMPASDLDPACNKAFFCTVCARQFSTNRVLSVHMRRHDMNVEEKRFLCTICARQYSSKSKLSVHMLKHDRHAEKKPFICTQCPYQCKMNCELRRHMLSHTGEKRFACKVCSFQCSQSGSLLVHMRKHTGEKPFACKICSYRCSEGGSLSKHMHIHTGEKPLGCEICSYRCSLKSSLIVHMRSHTGERPFVCELCTFRTSQRSHLSIHMRIHTGEKPFPCKLCSYRGISDGYLRQHMRSHSSNKQFSCDK